MLTDDEYKAMAQTECMQALKMATAKAVFEAEAAQILTLKVTAEKRTAELCMQRFQNENRPSIILKAMLERDGDMFVCSFGCLSVKGETPEIAFHNFDSAWVGSNE